MVEFCSLMPPSSRGLGRSPFKAKTGVRIPVEAQHKQHHRKVVFCIQQPFQYHRGTRVKTGVRIPVEAQDALHGRFCIQQPFRYHRGTGVKTGVRIPVEAQHKRHRMVVFCIQQPFQYHRGTRVKTGVRIPVEAQHKRHRMVVFCIQKPFRYHRGTLAKTGVRRVPRSGNPRRTRGTDSTTARWCFAFTRPFDTIEVQGLKPGFESPWRHNTNATAWWCFAFSSPFDTIEVHGLKPGFDVCHAVVIPLEVYRHYRKMGFFVCQHAKLLMIQAVSDSSFGAIIAFCRCTPHFHG
jgi:hypothetical protein